jgi:putative ubiquitin-RnfH superfamily antitoxin RatB of RatAB toxin-antitoxin module
MDAEFTAVAVSGVAATPRHVLHEGDRVELLRPLQLDPKQARRLRANSGRSRRPVEHRL